MKNRWNEHEAANCQNDLLKLRVYTSRLLGQDANLVLHGGGNTSVKIKEANIFGDEEDILYVKGSGWDLATIEAAGFAPVKLNTLKRLARLDTLSDLEMVKNQRMAMTNPSAPNPSVEAILHAIIPYTFVDHTHADAVVTISNTPNGRERIEDLYGQEMLIVPYVMPGFILAKEIYNMTKGLDWNTINGMILMNHGVFTFDNDARKSYEKMIAAVSAAEDYLSREGVQPLPDSVADDFASRQLAELRKAVSTVWQTPVLAKVNRSQKALAFSKLTNVREITDRGPLTPDHIIRTKRTPIVLSENMERDLQNYTEAYNRYFKDYNSGETQLDRAPRWAVWPGQGTISFGPSPKHVQIIEDITSHTMDAIYLAEQLGGWQALPPKDLFEMEYWSLEQAKLKKAGKPRPLQGRIAVVTGAYGGIGKACVDRLVEAGAAVAALDINPEIPHRFDNAGVIGLPCDLTNTDQMRAAIEMTVERFGGIDMLVTNAGIFPPSATIAGMKEDTWQKSLEINVTSHQRMIQYCIPFLELGYHPAIVIIGSKNVPAPGPGAGAYSVAKAGLTQLGRVAAMELGSKGIRVNIVHPNAVYDTAIWTPEVLQKRADHYGLTVEAYKTNNILKVEVQSRDVAELTYALLSDGLKKITGAQIPIDGGNDRVI